MIDKPKAEALPDALLTRDDLRGITALTYEDGAAQLNALLAPRVAARVAAALREAAEAAETVVSAGLSVLSKAEQRAYTGGRTDAAHRVRKLISAPAQAALDKLLAEQRLKTLHEARKKVCGGCEKDLPLVDGYGGFEHVALLGLGNYRGDPCRAPGIWKLIKEEEKK